MPAVRTSFCRTSLIATTLLALAALAAPRSAAAQATGDDGRAAFERGVAALDDGRFADAATAFETSYRARPAPVVLYDLGLAYRGLGRAVDAVDALTRYLAAPDAAATPDELAAVRAALAELRARVAEVALDVAPTRATLRVDARPATPRDGVLRLDPGTHIFEWTAPGFRGVHRELTVAAGEHARLTVRLPPAGPAPWVVPTVAVGAGVVVVAVVAIVLGFALAPSTLAPYEPSLGNVQAVRAW